MAVRERSRMHADATGRITCCLIFSRSRSSTDITVRIFVASVSSRLFSTSSAASSFDFSPSMSRCSATRVCSIATALSADAFSRSRCWATRSAPRARRISESRSFCRPASCALSLADSKRSSSAAFSALSFSALSTSRRSCRRCELSFSRARSSPAALSSRCSRATVSLSASAFAKPSRSCSRSFVFWVFCLCRSATQSAVDARCCVSCFSSLSTLSAVSSCAFFAESIADTLSASCSRSLTMSASRAVRFFCSLTSSADFAASCRSSSLICPFFSICFSCRTATSATSCSFLVRS